jgi:hypothetical protein
VGEIPKPNAKQQPPRSDIGSATRTLSILEQRESGSVKGVKVLVHSTAKPAPPSINVYHSDKSKGTSAKEPYQGSPLVGSIDNPTFEAPDQPLMLSFDTANRNTMTDLWVAVTWGE